MRLPPEIRKMWEITIFGVLWGPGNQCGIPYFYMILWISESFSLYFLVKNSFNFKLGLFTYFEYISEVIIRKNILRSDYHRNSFSGGKHRKNGILEVKITFSLQKVPQNYRFSWVNTKAVKCTCRFNTS